VFLLLRYTQAMPDQTPAATIESLEKKLYETRQALRELRKSQAQSAKDYTFETCEGSVQLSDIFAGGSDLLVVHNMGKHCHYCTLWADGLNGLSKPLLDRCPLVISSPDDPQTQADFAASRGWTLPMVSCGGNTFAADMGYHVLEKESYLPGVSAFHLRDDGSIIRTGHTPFGPFDEFCPVWPLFDLLMDGPGEWQPKFGY